MLHADEILRSGIRQEFGHFSPIAGIDNSHYPPRKLALLACRPSRELVDSLVNFNAREGEINLCTGDQREVSRIPAFAENTPTSESLGDFRYAYPECRKDKELSLVFSGRLAQTSTLTTLRG